MTGECKKNTLLAHSYAMTRGLHTPISYNPVGLSVQPVSKFENIRLATPQKSRS